MYLIYINSKLSHQFQPRKLGFLPTPGAAEKTLVQAGHVIPDKIRYSTGMGGGVLNYMFPDKIMTLHLEGLGVSFNEKNLLFTVYFSFHAQKLRASLIF